MKILFVNPIVYTSETKDVQKRKSIKDTMSYGFCKAFQESGNDITLYACASYKPAEQENYPFHVIFENPTMTSICHPNNLPRLPKLKKYLKENDFDWIICSEAFSLTTYTCVKRCPEKTVVWQELANYQKSMHQIPAKFWYKFIVKRKYRNVPFIARSQRAMEFISQFSNHVWDETIDHGVDLNQFTVSTEKKKQFIVVSQLIPRKRIDLIIDAFEEFCEKYDSSYKLIIIGDGVSRNELEKKTISLKFSSSIQFKGYLPHKDIIHDLSHSMGLLVATEKDNNLLTFNESLACGTPILTNMVPFMSSVIAEKGYGIAKDNWSGKELNDLVLNNDKFIKKIISNREELSYEYKVKQFINLFNELSINM